MIVELINTGSELMLGFVLNSNHQWLSRQLANCGSPVNRQVAVIDSASEIEQAVREALSRADLIITTGGLGPTSDDLTRDAVARMLGKKLSEDAAVLAQIRNFFMQRNRPVPAGTRVEACVPEGAVVLPNRNGTAPGLAIEVNPNPFRPGGSKSWLVMLPGPPRELRPMFADSVAPLLRRVLPPKELFVCRTLRTVGIGESVAQEKIAAPLKHLTDAGLDLGYCARPGQVDIRLAARGAGAESLVHHAELIVAAELGPHIFGWDEDELEGVVVKLLTERRQTLATAESCTGGCIANHLTNVPGASEVFLGGFVTYSNEAKQRYLGVPTETLACHGAVSEPVARAMAEGARCAAGSDYAIAVTGIAGPSGGTADKPVGTVFIALAAPEGTAVRLERNPWDRMTFKEATTRQALNQLRLLLKKIP